MRVLTNFIAIYLRKSNYSQLDVENNNIIKNKEFHKQFQN